LIDGKSEVGRGRGEKRRLEKKKNHKKKNIAMGKDRIFIIYYRGSKKKSVKSRKDLFGQIKKYISYCDAK
jgi:hypothetical protein